MARRRPAPPHPHPHHNQVSLVLEFCELGSLRDALDAHAFDNADGSLNYAAEQDTAADVARPMPHRHNQQVRRAPLSLGAVCHVLRFLQQREDASVLVRRRPVDRPTGALRPALA